MRHVFSLLLLLAAVACRETTEIPPVGPLDGAIITGQNQIVTAGAPRLPEPVTEQIVRSKTGQITMRRVPAWEKLLLPRLAFAQTVVNGSPVAGAVVCVYDQDKDLIPFSRCTNTDANGHATFFFVPPTKSGSYIARINGSITTNGVVEATTFDTVHAKVLATLPDSGYSSEDIFGGPFGPLASPARVPSNALFDKYGNAVPFRITADARLTPGDTVLGSDGARTATFTAADGVQHTTLLTGEGGASLANLVYRIVPNGGSPRITWVVCGLGRTCNP